ncbi:hypothetical protein [Mycobacterium sp. 48b]|uniref:hypothetical protein n=1 Tax=Mycobacterium sp. 48b TaxID=3400426 RepID=UPI003AAB2A57
MAREYARIRISIAGDDHIEELSPAAQWLYFRILIPDPQLTHCGVTRWLPKRLIHKAAGLTLDYILAAAAELERERFALFDDNTEEVLVRSYLRSEELLRNPKMAVAVGDAYLGVASRQLKAAIASEVHRDKADHPDYSSWTHSISREAVELLLTAKTSDEVPYVDTFTNPNPVRNGDTEPVPTTNRNRNQKPNPDRGDETQSEHQADSLHLVPTSLQPAHVEGYVSTEGNQGTEPDPSSPPPRYCPKHMPSGTNESCPPCGNHRRAFDAWMANATLDEKRAEQERAQAEAAERAQAAASRAMSIAECELCDDDGYRGTTVCDHQEHADTNARGMAMVRAAMAKGDDQ